jgi:hypothetical protein
MKRLPIKRTVEEDLEWAKRIANVDKAYDEFVRKVKDGVYKKDGITWYDNQVYYKPHFVRFAKSDTLD